MGLVLAAFTWAYALGQVPAGWFGDRFGPKKVLTVIMTLWSATAVMTGAALGFGSLFGARFLLGPERGGRVSGGEPRHAALVSARRARAHPGNHAFLQPLRGGGHAIHCGQHPARLRLARDFLHLRFARHCVGHRLQLSFTGTFPKITKASIAPN